MKLTKKELKIIKTAKLKKQGFWKDQVIGEICEGRGLGYPKVGMFEGKQVEVLEAISKALR